MSMPSVFPGSSSTSTRFMNTHDHTTRGMSTVIISANRIENPQTTHRQAENGAACMIKNVYNRGDVSTQIVAIYHLHIPTIGSALNLHLRGYHSRLRSFCFIASWSKAIGNRV